MNVIGVRILFVHDLDIELPPWELAPLDGFVKVSLIALAITRDDLCRLCVRQVLYTLLRFEGKLHPKTLVVGVDEAVGVASKGMHVAKAARDATIAHHDGYLVQRFGQVRPEVPVVIGAAHSRSGI